MKRHATGAATRVLWLIMLTLGFLALAGCEGKRVREEAAQTPSPPLNPALFPVVLDRDVRIVARADGSGVTELPVEAPIVSSYSGVSPDGKRTASYRAGGLFVQEGAGEPRQIASVDASLEYVSFFWSPDSSRLAYLIPSPEFQNGGPMYVVRADGGEPAFVSEVSLGGGEGADNLTWSPDGSRIATFAPRSNGVRVLSTSGGPPLDVAANPAHFSFSPDSRFLAFDSPEISTDPAAPGKENIIIVDVGSRATRTLHEGRWPRWSPAGDRIAFKGGRSPSHVYTIHPDGTGLADLGSIGAEIYNDLRWSADGQQVEFVRGGPNFPVYAIDLRTAAVTRRDSGYSGYDVDYSGPLSAHKSPIQISPDGGRLAFPGYGGGRHGWLILDIASGAVTWLNGVIRGDRAGDILWSESGARLAYPDGQSGVFVAEGGDSSPRRISALDARQVAWSADGARLAIATSSGIIVVSVAGTEHRSIDIGDLGASRSVGGLAWSPDGKRLLYEISRAGDEGAPLFQIFTAEVDGAHVTPLTDAGENTFGASWSPDGRTIAYDRLSGTATEVWLVGVDGANARRLSASGGGQLQWSPNGARIASVAGLDLNVVDVATGSVVHVAEVGRAAAPPRGNCSELVVRWSDDGTKLWVVLACHSPQI